MRHYAFFLLVLCICFGGAGLATVCNDLVPRKIVLCSLSKDMYLEETFDKRLQEHVKNAPNSQLMVFVTNNGMLDFTRNSLCSLMHQNVSKSSFVVVTTDEPSFAALQDEYGDSLLFFPSNFTRNMVNNQQKKEFYEIVKLRPRIGFKILRMGINAIISDVDIVFLANPLTLLAGDADLEVATDSDIIFRHPPGDFPVWNANLGFYQMRRSESMLWFVSFWEREMTRIKDSNDQTVLKTLLVAGLKKIADDRFESTFHNQSIFIRYLDPMLATNAGGVFLTGSELWKKEALKRQIDHPVLCHFFHIGEVQEKLTMMKSKKLWYLDREGKCMAKLPSGSNWSWWRS